MYRAVGVPCQKAQEVAAEKMKPLMGGMNLPGM